MENKFKTLNNWVSQSVLHHLTECYPRGVFHLLYNCGDMLEHEVFNRTCHLVVSWYGIDMMPKIIEDTTLTPEVKAFAIRLFVTSFEKIHEKLKKEIENGTEVAKQAEITD